MKKEYAARFLYKKERMNENDRATPTYKIPIASIERTPRTILPKRKLANTVSGNNVKREIHAIENTFVFFFSSPSAPIRICFGLSLRVFATAGINEAAVIMTIKARHSAL